MTTYQTDELRLALDLCVKSHSGLEGADGMAQATHSIAVAQQLNRHSDTTIAAALLHDVLEDTPLTADDLASAGISQRVIDIVEMLTRTKDQSYAEYIDSLYTDGTAVIIKLADIADNRRKGAGYNPSLQRRYDIAQLALRASLFDDMLESHADYNHAQGDVYPNLAKTFANEGPFACARHIIDKTGEWERSHALCEAVRDTSVSGHLLAMLLLSCTTLDIEDMCALIHTVYDEGAPLATRILSVCSNTDTPIGELICLLTRFSAE